MTERRGDPIVRLEPWGEAQTMAPGRRFEGRTVVVTGAGGPIGAETARRFAAEGALVFVTDVLDQPLASLADDLTSQGAQVRALAVDLNDPGSSESVIASAEQDLGPVYAVAVVHGNIGETLPGPRTPGARLTVDNLSDAEWDRVMANNLRSVFALCRAAVGAMEARRQGRIVTVGSIAMSGQPWMRGRLLAHYAGAKAGLVGFTRALAMDAVANGVIVNCVVPGSIMTEEREAERAREDPAAMEARLQRIPRGRIGRPGDIAEAILYLCSADADFIVGQTIHVNGGEWMP